MNRSRFHHTILALLLLVSIAGCGKTPPTGPVPDPDPVPGPVPGTTTGIIQGIVTEAVSGAPIASATVTTRPATASALTNAAGEYSISNVAPGEYVVRSERDGFDPDSATVTVSAGATATCSGHLRPVQLECEDNGSFTTANDMRTNVTIRGKIGPGGVDDLDTYRIVVPGDRVGTLKLQVGNRNLPGAGSMGTTAILDAAYASLATSGSVTAPSVTDPVGAVPVTPGATYFITVKRYGTEAVAPYQIEPNFTPAAWQDALEGNDSPGTAADLVAGEVTATIGYGVTPDDEDWYKVTGPASGQLRVTIANLHPGSGVVHGAVGTARVLTSALVSLKTSGTWTTPNVTDTIGPVSVTPGATYYISVHRYSTTHCAPYRLNVFAN